MLAASLGLWLWKLIWSNTGSATKGTMLVYVCVCVCVEKDEKESVREKEKRREKKSKGWTRTCHGQDTLITATEKKKKKCSGSLAPSLCSVLQSFTRSLSPRTQWINQIPTQLFHFTPFYTWTIQLSPSAPEKGSPGKSKLHLTFKFRWHWSASQTLTMLFRKTVQIYYKQSIFVHWRLTYVSHN